jgi:hypothetical protein
MNRVSWFLSAVIMILVLVMVSPAGATFSGIWPFTRQPVTVCFQTNGTDAVIQYVDNGDEPYDDSYPIPQNVAVEQVPGGIVLSGSIFLERQDQVFLPVIMNGDQ